LKEEAVPLPGGLFVLAFDFVASLHTARDFLLPARVFLRLMHVARRVVGLATARYSWATAAFEILFLSFSDHVCDVAR
jgi:hypothetical protein